MLFVMLALPYVLDRRVEHGKSWDQRASSVTVHQSSNTAFEAAEIKRGTHDSPLVVHDPDVALWTRWLVVGTFLLAAYTAALFYATRRLAVDARASSERQAMDTKASLDLTRNIFSAEQRAWIPLSVALEKGLNWGPNGATITLLFRLQNVGRTPALNVSVTVRASPFGCGFPTPDRLQKTISEAQRHQKFNEGFTIFPSLEGAVDFVLSFNLSDGDVAAAKKWWQEGFGTACPGITIVIVGCISYQVVFGGEQHQTGFMLELHKFDPQHPNGRFLIEFGKDLPVAELRLGRLFMFGGGITD